MVVYTLVQVYTLDAILTRRRILDNEWVFVVTMEITMVAYQKALVLVLFEKIIKVKIMPNLNVKVDCVLNTPLYLGGFFSLQLLLFRQRKNV